MSKKKYVDADTKSLLRPSNEVVRERISLTSHGSFGHLAVSLTDDSNKRAFLVAQNRTVNSLGLLTGREGIKVIDDYPSLKELLVAVSMGNARASQILYERYDYRFHKFARRYLWRKGCWNSDDHLDGIIQSAWIKIFKSIEGLRNCNSFIPWCYRIIRREADTHLRYCIRRQWEVPLEDVTREKEPAARIDSADEVTESAERLDKMLAYAKEIHPKLPEILLLRELEGWDFHAIALRVGESYGNVRTIHSRGLIKLRTKLRDKEF